MNILLAGATGLVGRHDLTQVDARGHDAVLTFAELARAAGLSHFVVVTAVDATLKPGAAAMGRELIWR